MDQKFKDIKNSNLYLALSNIGKNVNHYKITNESFVRGINDVANHSGSLARWIDQEKSLILNDDNLTEVGMREKLTELKEKVSQEIQKIELYFPYDSHVAKISSTIKLDQSAKDSELHREIRTEAKAMKPHERSQLYLHACKTGCDDELVAAFAGQLKSFPLISDDDLQKGNQLQTERLFPVQSQQLKQVEGAKIIVQGIIGALRKGLNEGS